MGLFAVAVLPSVMNNVRVFLQNVARREEGSSIYDYASDIVPPPIVPRPVTQISIVPNTPGSDASPGSGPRRRVPSEYDWSGGRSQS